MFTIVTPLITGLCWVDVNPFGPDQLYAVPPAGAFRLTLLLRQAAGIVGKAMTELPRMVTLTVVLALQPNAVAVTVYTPVFTELVDAIVGFCKVELKPPGPLQL